MLREQEDAIFDKYDLNKDGELQREEVYNMFEELTRTRNKTADRDTIEEYAKKFMDSIDTSKDGNISKA